MNQLLIVGDGQEICINDRGTLRFEGTGRLEFPVSHPLAKGIIQLPLSAARLIASNEIPNTAASPPGGILTSDTDPAFGRVNGATDKALRVRWPAGSIVELALPPFVYPLELDDTMEVAVKLLAKMAGSTDTPTIAVGYFEGIGDTDAGGATDSALSSTLAVITRRISLSDVGAAPAQASVTLTPGTHGTDAIDLFAAWIEFRRKKA
jgi:hypothetical protein